ncbi:hypothetical protein RJ640_006990 [Escallonia rubra]|uniref:Retrovirus-related Pol polyprotein from transposon TNT 1-94 n=1 Tax=Escallonia rubra TaxID=112253 RepID=A0AA88R1W5_9ASTE|nr:hypothetical protein RJ640_006990 [Escallonia rubra]
MGNHAKGGVDKPKAWHKGNHHASTRKPKGQNLQEKRASLRMNEGSDLGDHILEFNRLVSQLSSIDVKLNKEDQTILLLSSLPKSYETLKTTLFIEKETLLVDDVISALMDSSRVNGMSSSSQGEGLVVKFENKNGYERKDNKNKKKHVNNANVAEKDDKSSDGDLYLVSSVEQQKEGIENLSKQNKEASYKSKPREHHQKDLPLEDQKLQHPLPLEA